MTDSMLDYAVRILMFALIVASLLILISGGFTTAVLEGEIKAEIFAHRIGNMLIDDQQQLVESAWTDDALHKILDTDNLQSLENRNLLRYDIKVDLLDFETKTPLRSTIFYRPVDKGTNLHIVDLYEGSGSKSVYKTVLIDRPVYVASTKTDAVLRMTISLREDLS